MNALPSLRGTCEWPECPMRGVCHCGCGAITSVITKTNRKEHLLRGNPSAYKHTHNPLHNSALRPGGKGKIPRSRVRPLVTFLVKHYGSQSEAAKRVGVSTFVLKPTRPSQRVTIRTAERLVTAVLALQPPDRAHRLRHALSLERGDVAIEARDQKRLQDRDYQRQRRAALRVSA